MLVFESCLNFTFYMCRFLFLFALLWVTHAAQAQVRVNNVRFTLNNSGVLETQYDIQGIASSDSVYLVANGQQSGKLTPITVSGAVGRRVTAGTSKTIYWDIVKDGYKINEEVTVTVLVKLASGRLPQSAPTIGEAGSTRLTAPVAIVQPIEQPPVTQQPPVVQQPPVDKPAAPQPEPVKTDDVKSVRSEPVKAPENKNVAVTTTPKKDEPTKEAAPVANAPTTKSVENGPALAPQRADLRNVRWGYRHKQVKETERSRASSSNSDKITYNRISLAGRNVGLDYEFNGDSLISATYFYYVTSAIGRDNVIAASVDFETSLTRKYGPGKTSFFGDIRRVIWLIPRTQITLAIGSVANGGWSVEINYQCRFCGPDKVKPSMLKDFTPLSDVKDF